jgi:nicotinate dehydrogenase subunit A
MPADAARHAMQVNGRHVDVVARDDEPLIHVLRNDLGLTGAKLGCGAERCGACRVLIDGQPRYSCTTLVGAAAGRSITTVEGMREHRVVAALEAHNAGQCGICLSGIVVAAVALFEHDPHPSRTAIRAALAPQLCRCGAQPRILRALETLAGARSGTAQHER